MHLFGVNVVSYLGENCPGFYGVQLLGSLEGSLSNISGLVFLMLFY